MYKYNNSLFLFFVLFFICSCNKDHFIDSNLSDVPDKKKIEDIDKVSDALKYLNTTFLQYDSENSNTATYSRNSNVLSNPLRISDIDTIYDFRLTQHEPLLKLVCLKKNGYFLTSYLDLNINKVPPVLFYSENKFNPNNVNPGLIDYINSFVEGKIAQDKYLASNPSMKFSLFPMIIGGGGIDPRADRVNPLLKTYWSQDKEKGFFVMMNGKKMTVGCVPVAIGQTLFYYYYNNPNRPKKLDNFDFHYPNFSAMKLTEGTEATRKFLYMIGYYTDAEWGVNYTGAYSGESVGLFEAMEIDANVSNYNSSDVVHSLADGRPVVLRGSMERKVKDAYLFGITYWPINNSSIRYTYSGGHAWVCDGYFYSKYGYLFLHMNWGWGESYSKSDSNILYGAGWTYYTDWETGNSIVGKASYNYLKKMVITKPRFPF
ncbi:C10 family peptidase [Ichthyobacterium seriolicida]|uniref:C10 family peptidase n=1 Tax=Ichthyobacterium seriolicida TaxID=242600 RepID=UPI000BBBD9EB|nr:C10 family peptidase [Ichthyobacterium seriolicida]